VESRRSGGKQRGTRRRSNRDAAANATVCERADERIIVEVENLLTALTRSLRSLVPTHSAMRHDRRAVVVATRNAVSASGGGGHLARRHDEQTAECHSSRRNGALPSPHAPRDCEMSKLWRCGRRCGAGGRAGRSRRSQAESSSHSTDFADFSSCHVVLGLVASNPVLFAAQTGTICLFSSLRGNNRDYARHEIVRTVSTVRSDFSFLHHVDL
jgi:hypothetical protein